MKRRPPARSATRLGALGALGLSRVLFATIAALTAGAASAADAPKLSAQLEPDPIGVAELATFTLTVESSGFGAPDVSPDFRLDNFQIAAGPFRSQSQSWVNGVTSSTTELVWRLRPLGVGSAAVRALRVKVGDDLLQIADAAIQVVAEAPPRAAPQRRPQQDPFGGLFGNDPFGDDPFSRFEGRGRRAPQADPKLRALAVAEPATVWAGQQLVWRLLLDTQTDVSRVEPKSLPDFKGFWVRDITPAETPPPRWVEVGGEKYARVPVIERALFPLEAGSRSVSAVDLQVLAQVVEAGFFQPMARPKAVDLGANAVTVTVKPLPPAPSGFSGVVGQLELSAKLDRATLDAGQAASLTLFATSDGHLQALEPPVLALPEGLRTFPPTRESEEKVLGGRLETTVRWKYVLLADRSGHYRLPALELGYFDPGSASYRSARTTPLEVAVREPARAAAPASGGSGTSAPLATSASAEPPLVSRGVVTAVLGAVGAVALVALALAIWRRTRRAGRPAQELKGALAAGQAEPSPRAAAALVEEAWLQFLGERWSIPRSTPSAGWPSRLAAQGLPAELGHELATLFEELHFLAYAPELADVEAHRTEVLSRSRRLLRRLR